jgi:hypothetical protein
MNRYYLPSLLAAFLVAGTEGFTLTPSPTGKPTRHLSMAKGFGKEVRSSTPKVDVSVPPDSEPVVPDEPIINTGQEALTRLRRVEAEKRNEELRSIRDLRSVDQSLSENPNAAVIPEKVAQRMGMRMLPFVGVPLFGVMGIFVVFWYLATYKNMEFQPALVAFSTIGALGVGLIVSSFFLKGACYDFLSLSYFHHLLQQILIIQGYNVFSNECFMGRR